MRVTQGAFSFLPDLSDGEIRAQIEYCLKNGWAVSVEYTDDAHPRNTFWEMFGMPMFDLKDAAGVMDEVVRCRQTFPNHYVKVNAFDSSHGWESLRLSFIVNRDRKSTRLNSSHHSISYAVLCLKKKKKTHTKHTHPNKKTKNHTTQHQTHKK